MGVGCVRGCTDTVVVYVPSYTISNSNQGKASPMQISNTLLPTALDTA